MSLKYSQFGVKQTFYPRSAFEFPLINHRSSSCRPSWDALNQGIYQLVLALLFYVLPMVLMALTYTHIATVLWKHEIPGVVVGAKISGRYECWRYSSYVSVLKVALCVSV